MEPNDDVYRESDIRFLALLKTLTLAELMRLETTWLVQAVPWRKVACDRAIWRAMLK